MSFDELFSDLLALKTQRKRPPVVVHCGSTQHAMHTFEEYRLRDTLDGLIVLTIGASKHDKELGITSEQSTQLDLLHLFKIDLADSVRVLNTGGYIGASTLREIAYASYLGKPIYHLERPPTTLLDVHCSVCKCLLQPVTTYFQNKSIYCPGCFPTDNTYQGDSYTA